MVSLLKYKHHQKKFLFHKSTTKFNWEKQEDLIEHLRVLFDKTIMIALFFMQKVNKGLEVIKQKK